MLSTYEAIVTSNWMLYCSSYQSNVKDYALGVALSKVSWNFLSKWWTINCSLWGLNCPIRCKIFCLYTMKIIFTFNERKSEFELKIWTCLTVFAGSIFILEIREVEKLISLIEEDGFRLFFYKASVFYPDNYGEIGGPL